MPQPRIANFWVEEIRRITVNSGRLGPSKVRAQLVAWVKDGGAPHGVNQYEAPSQRTIARYQSEIRDEPPEKQAPYRNFYWPESMEAGDVPWEAAPAALEVFRGYLSTSRIRPTVTLVHWFWRVSLAVPDADFNKRLHWAHVLELSQKWMREGLDIEPPRDIELELVFQPWRSEADANEFELAKAMGLPREPYEEVELTDEEGNVIGRETRFHSRARVPASMPSAGEDEVSKEVRHGEAS